MFFVERLESMLATGRKLPLTNNVVIDQAGALELVDELRRAIPDEVQDARRINAEGERILERAQEEAERIVARAQEQAAYLIGEEGLTEAAEAEGRRIVGEARTEADAVRQGADEYAASVLTGLEGDVVRTLQSIRSGLALLDSRTAGPEPAAGTEPASAAGAEWDQDEAGAPSR
jgi:hypothetical protein